MEYYDEEFNFKRELEEIHKKYILGLPSSGRIYRLLRNRDRSTCRVRNSPTKR